MENFLRLFDKALLFVYHCFDRLVINGYLIGLFRPEQVSYFFRNVAGVPCITKEVLSRRTADYVHWVEAYARKHRVEIQWAEKKVRKEDFVKPFLLRMQRSGKTGVYFIFMSMEQGWTFRSFVPKFPVPDPDFRFLRRQRSRYKHFYFYILDPILGPMVMRAATFLPFAVTFYLNGHSFIEGELKRRGLRFRKSDNAFLSVSDPQSLQEAADDFTPEVIRKQLEHWSLVLGPKFSRPERRAMNLERSYAVSQVEYCRNFIFRNHFPIHKIFERSCELGMLSLTADKIAQIFGTRVTRQLKGKLQSILGKTDHGHHVLRAYLKNSFVKQYEKFSTFLRHEVCSNNLADLHLKKGLDHLLAVRQRFSGILDRFAAHHAQGLNAHVDFPLFQRMAMTVTVGNTRIPGIKIQDTRMMRLFEVLLHASTTLAGITTKDIHQRVIETFGLNPKSYSLNQLRYDLRKMRAHGLLERVGKHYAYRLTDKGVKAAWMFVLFHRRICGPLANSLFNRRPDPALKPNGKLEAAYHKADEAIEKIIALVQAA
jgi:hypothetical protein